MDPAELTRLYDAHAAGLFHYLLSFAKSEADARDLLQEVFIRLARVKPADVAWRNERAFVYRIAHNLAVDWLRLSRSKERLIEKCTVEAEGKFDAGGDPDAREFAAQLRSAFAELPDEQRTVAQLKLWEGLTFEEIAEAQDIPLNTAASRYRYALDKLRTLLRPIYGELQ
jgi:RNA polymerase sigma-70 factor (ECF subfamily)